MEFMIPVFRLAHFVGFALLLGGMISSIVITHKQESSRTSILFSWKILHLIVSPGLILLLISGVLQTWAMYFEHFKNSGYMHAKILLVLIIFTLIFIDMKKQKNILKTKPEINLLIKIIKKRQLIALTTCLLIFLIMWLVTYRPF